MEKDATVETNGERTEEPTEESFLKDLYFFMKQRDTPIERIPHLGFKQIDLYVMFKAVKELGGYHQVTAQQLWKKIYNILGGNPRSTSAATCTRRHYEKLLLAYEYHLAGYGDEVPISPPRKRFRYDEYPPSAKRADFRHVTHFNQFIHPRPEALPGYFPLTQSVPTVRSLGAQIVPRASSAYLPALAFDTGSFRQPLDLLRHLAEEYKSTSGLVEPLNLSKKCSKMETTSNSPSSFAPLSTKKEPKFLNEAPPLYPSRGMAVDELGDQPGSVGGASMEKGPTPAQAIISPLRLDEPPERIIPTSSASSSTLWKAPPSPTPLLTHRASYSSTLPVSEPEKSFHAPWGKSRSSTPTQPSPVPFSSSHAPIGPPRDPYSGMEIQIPLSLLQKWIKESIFYNSVAPTQHMPRHEPTKARSSPELISRERLNSETLARLSDDQPADLSLKKHSRDPQEPKDDGSKHTPISFTSPMTANESHPAAADRSASVKPFRLCAPIQAPFSRELYHYGSPLKALEALEQDVGTRQPYAAATEGQAYVGHVSQGRGLVSAPAGVPWLQKTSGKSMAPSPPLVTVNSTSPPLIQVTPEQLKLLISSSPFRHEQRKIC
uniref:ARID domain-containing protein n=1 Tax=Electrophorus electricus TaxID=8005 RepID=A0A4W4FWV7_ELEEL